MKSWRAINAERFEAIKRLLDMDFPIKEIMNVTGTSKQTIYKIKKAGSLQEYRMLSQKSKKGLSIGSEQTVDVRRLAVAELQKLNEALTRIFATN